MIKIQSVSVPGCVECAHFEKFWEGIKGDFPKVEMEKRDATTPEGLLLNAQYGIMAAPGIIINDELFSMGGINKERFIARLKELGGSDA